MTTPLLSTMTAVQPAGKRCWSRTSTNRLGVKTISSRPTAMVSRSTGTATATCAFFDTWPTNRSDTPVGS